MARLDCKRYNESKASHLLWATLFCRLIQSTAWPDGILCRAVVRDCQEAGVVPLMPLQHWQRLLFLQQEQGSASGQGKVSPTLVWALMNNKQVKERAGAVAGNDSRP